MIQAVTFAAIDEIETGTVDEGTAIRLAGDTVVAILLPA